MFIIQGKDSKLPIFLLLLYFWKGKLNFVSLLLISILKIVYHLTICFIWCIFLFLKFPIRLFYSFFRNKSLHFVLRVANNLKLRWSSMFSKKEKLVLSRPFYTSFCVPVFLFSSLTTENWINHLWDLFPFELCCNCGLISLLLILTYLSIFEY